MSDQETATIAVLRTSDAKKTNIDVNMTASLNDLKDKIDGSDAFGPLSRTNQRLFHLGRELKTGGRSLANLGVGRFKCFTVHLLAKNVAGGTTKKKRKSRADDEDVVEVVGNKRKTRSAATRQSAASRRQQQQQVIELGDSDDDDDDDDVVEVVAPPPRRTRNRR